MTPREIATSINNDGIQCKKNGNYELAYERYQQAKLLDPTGKNSYLNLYKLLLGLGKSTATKNILIFKHLDFLESTQETFELSNITPWQDYYRWDGEINERNTPNNIVLAAVHKIPLYSLLAYDINTCFNAGLGVLLSDNSIVKFHGIKNEQIENYKLILLGQKPNGEDLRSSKFENLVNIIGFMFLMYNLKLANKIEPSEVLNLY